MSTKGFIALAIVGVIIALFMIFGFSVIGAGNNAIEKEENIEENLANISITKNKANDVLVLISEALDDSNARYLEVMTAITDARSDEATVETVNLAIDVIMEAYPEGDANNAVLYDNYMTAIRLEAESLARYREAYNAAVRDYNAYVRKFPKSLYLDIYGYRVIDYDYITIPNSQSDGPLD